MTKTISNLPDPGVGSLPPATSAAKIIASHHPAAAPDYVTDLHAQLLRHADLQFDLPSFQEPTPPAWLKWLRDFLSSAGPELDWLFWIVVALLAALLLYVLARQALRLWRARVPKVAAATVMAPWQPPPEQARLLLHDADALAARGLFADAIHLLLLRGIRDIEERFPRLVRPAFTSREIGRLDTLPPPARTAFGAIAGVVERSLFGGAPVGAEDFAFCRNTYEHFAFPANWSGAK